MQGTNGYDTKPIRATDLLRTRMLIIAATEADAEYDELNDLGFVIVSGTSLVSDLVYSVPADDKGLNRWSLSRSGRKIHLKSFHLINAVVSMGRRNTRLEHRWHGRQKPKPLTRVRPAGTLPWLSFVQAKPNRWFSRASFVESTCWMVLRRPSELAALTGELKGYLKWTVTRLLRTLRG